MTRTVYHFDLSCGFWITTVEFSSWNQQPNCQPCWSHHRMVQTNPKRMANESLGLPSLPMILIHPRGIQKCIAAGARRPVKTDENWEKKGPHLFSRCGSAAHENTSCIFSRQNARKPNAAVAKPFKSTEYCP